MKNVWANVGQSFFVAFVEAYKGFLKWSCLRF